MKKKLIYQLSSLFFFECNSSYGSNRPGADPDAVAAPIDQNIWILALIGIVYTIIKLNKTRITQKNQIG